MCQKAAETRKFIAAYTIPPRSNISALRPVDWYTYKERHLVECFFQKLKFRLGLKSGELLVYIYFQYHKGAHSDQCWPSYSTIGAAVGMSRKTVQKHIGALIGKGLVRAEYTSVFVHGQKVNGNLLYTLKSVEQVLREREKAQLDKLKQAEAQHKWDEKVKHMAGTSQA